MNIKNEIERLFGAYNILVSERALVVDVSFEFCCRGRSLKKNITDFFSILPLRDSVTIKLEIDNGDEIIVERNKAFPDQQYDNAMRFVDASTIAEANIEINKAISEGQFSIYSFESFSRELLALPLEGIMLSFSNLMKGQDRLVFQLLDDGSFFSTETMAFVPVNQSCSLSPFARAKKLEDCTEVSSFQNKPILELLPDDFAIRIDYDNNPFREVFDSICALLSLAYISNNATFENGMLEAQIVGQRKVEASFDPQKECNNEFYKIYHWIFTDGNPVDKAILARNIISLHCRLSKLSSLDGKTLSSIESNYKIYLKENVKQYIELKNQIAEFICNVISRIGEYTYEILSGLKKNLLAFSGFLLTAVLANIVSNQPLDNLFTRDITRIIELVLLGSLIYLVICDFETWSKLKKAMAGYNKLKTNYESLLSEEDIKDVFDEDSLMKDSKKSSIKTIVIINIVWLALLIACFVFIESVSSDPIIAPYISKVFHAAGERVSYL